MRVTPPPPAQTLRILLCASGADPGFSSGGAKDLCERTHITNAMPEVPYGRVPGPAARALEALGVFYALSCYLSLILEHSDTKWDF